MLLKMLSKLNFTSVTYFVDLAVKMYQLYSFEGLNNIGVTQC
jgi:hypothetical protein